MAFFYDMQCSTHQLTVPFTASVSASVPGGPQEDEHKDKISLTIHTTTDVYTPFNLERRTSIDIYLLYCYFRIHHRESNFPLYNLWWYIRIPLSSWWCLLARNLTAPVFNLLTSFAILINNLPPCTLQIQHFMILLLICATIHSTHLTGVASWMKEYTCHT